MTLPGDPDDALQTDVYLEQLLAAHSRRPRAVAEVEPPGADPRVAAAARALERRLIRFHPSFRFEDALAARLRPLAGGLSSTRPSEADVAGPVVLPAAMPFPSPPEEIPEPEPLGHLQPRSRLFVSGAIASGVSLAGAAVIAWRRVRPAAAPARGPLDRGSRRTPSAARRAQRLGSVLSRRID